MAPHHGTFSSTEKNIGKRKKSGIIIFLLLLTVSLSSCAVGRKTHDTLFGATPLILEFEYSPETVAGAIHEIFVEHGYDITSHDKDLIAEYDARFSVKEPARPGY